MNKCESRGVWGRKSTFYGAVPHQDHNWERKHRLDEIPAVTSHSCCSGVLWVPNLELGSCKRGTGLRVACPQVPAPCAANLLPPTLPMWIRPRQRSALWISIELPHFTHILLFKRRDCNGQTPPSAPALSPKWGPVAVLLLHPASAETPAQLPASLPWQQCWDRLLSTQADVPEEIRSVQEQLLLGTAVPVLWGREKTD